MLYHKLNVDIYIYTYITININIYIYVLWLRIYVYTGNSQSPCSIPSSFDSPQLIRTTQDVVQFDGDMALILELLVHRFTGSARVGKEVPGLRQG